MRNMIPIRLEWQRPADGLDLVHDDDLARRHVNGNGWVARPRSDRTVPVTYEVTNLEDPIVIRLINCRDDEDRLAFLARFGFLRDEGPGWDGSWAGIDVDQYRFTVGLILSTSDQNPTPTAQANHVMNEAGFGARLRPSFEMTGPGGALRLVLHPDSLSSFMAMEIALAHEAGAVATSCEHCGKFFLTGPLTGHRSHAKYCSDRCRVAAMRKRNAAKGE